MDILSCRWGSVLSLSYATIRRAAERIAVERHSASETEVALAELDEGNAIEAEEAIIAANEIQEPISEENQAGKAGETNENVETLENEESDASTEKAKAEFTCLICDFVSNWENGLQIHMQCWQF